MKKLLITVCILFLTENPCQGSNYYTVSGGAWTAPATWLSGSVPPLMGGDSIFIYHNVMYTSFLHMVTATYIFIDTGGTLCGHRKFSIQSGSVMDNHGEFNADSLYINGGLLNNFGNILLANSAVVSNGGSLFNSGTMQIGAIFLCTEETNAITETIDVDPFSIYPSPVVAGEKIRILFPNRNTETELSLLNMSGELVLQQPLKDEELETTALTPGIYFLRINSDNNFFYKKLVVIGKQ